jgi:two-component system chemotaxis response regulator CheB
MTRKRGRIRVLIVEDSKVAAIQLEQVLAEDGRFEVVGVAGSGEDALALMPRLGPDIVLMDVQLPGMDGVETTRRIMQTRPTPIVITSASISNPTVTVSLEALKAGALSVAEKPLGRRRDEFPRLARRLCQQLAIMSEVRVVPQRHPAARPLIQAGGGTARSRSTARYEILGMVASTGGPAALAKVLGALPREFPLPVAVVQHIGAEFTEGFAAWLDSQVPMAVRLACHGEGLAPGHVYVAPGGCHLIAGQDMLMLSREPPVGGQRPSGTMLLRSIAASFAERAIGVVLTGMGDDGAAGLLAMRQSGAHTIAQDEASAVVYGMPAVAARTGAARLQLPLDAIGPHLLQTAKDGRPT